MRSKSGVSIGAWVLLLSVPAILPLVVLASSPGAAFPGLPVYRYQPLPGDAYGYYACAREIQAAVRRDAPLFAAAVIGSVALVLLARRGSRSTFWIGVSWAVGLPAAVIASSVHFTGAAQLGWPLVWSVVLAPVRAVGLSVRPGPAFAFGLGLSIALNACTVAATYLLGLRAGLGRGVALGGAALVALWPLLSLLTGSGATRNGTWQIVLGLSLYTEPLSTALVVVVLAVLVGRTVEPYLVAVAGGLLGFATLVRLSNALVIVCVLAGFLLGRDRRRAGILTLAACGWLPAVLLFWPKSYPKLKPPVFPAHPFEFAYAATAWTQSSLWHPAVLAVLLPPALLGLRRGRRAASVLLWSIVLVTATFYSFYELTPLHPRFLFVILPVVLLYFAAGVAVVLSTARNLYDRAA